MFTGWWGSTEDIGDRFVIKTVSEDIDSRYNRTREQRQQAQLDALRRNREITTDVYLGLAPIFGDILNCFSPEGKIVLGEVIENPEQRNLDPNFEYALVMLHLSEELQLNNLLKHDIVPFRTYYIKFVTERIAYMHQNLKPLSDSKKWGSSQQLKGKLLENLQLADQMLVKQPQHKATVELLKKSLLDIFQQLRYLRYFERRKIEKHIKRCHGDLKTQNIWVIDTDPLSKKYWQSVKILDAIDFNPAFSHIDILSDFAMLVVDVQVQTGSESLANEMIEFYLRLTQQESELARFIFNYYLTEKALVRAAVSIIHDNEPKLGHRFLEVAKLREKELCVYHYTK
ncbi:MAG TPA: hypothetical protein VEP90_14680 [Methylomirabilota bacterium]|nr:hypothetical protein [Methylomirabilota bacterium]